MATATERIIAPPDTGGDSRTARALIVVLRVGLALLWIENAGWKTPPDFTSLQKFTMYAVEYPVFAPFTWVTEALVLSLIHI